MCSTYTGKSRVFVCLQSPGSLLHVLANFPRDVHLSVRNILYRHNKRITAWCENVREGWEVYIGDCRALLIIQAASKEPLLTSLVRNHFRGEAKCSCIHRIQDHNSLTPTGKG